VRTIVRVAGDVLRFVSSTLRPHAQLAAENLFLRKQLALYLERRVKPRRADDATRIALVALSRLIDWRRLLTVVKPERSFDGIEEDSGCSGGGNRCRVADPDCRPTFGT
jgi:hypothetical protein